MLYVKPVPDVDILFTFVTVYLSVFFSFSYCQPVCGEIKIYINVFSGSVTWTEGRSSPPRHGSATGAPVLCKRSESYRLSCWAAARE